MAQALNTLRYNASRCINCGMCYTVCPHGVFAAPMVSGSLSGGLRLGTGLAVRRPAARLVATERCMECGACQRNCPVGAIAVDSGVGCATGIINGILLRWGLTTNAGAYCYTSCGDDNAC